MSLRNKTMRLKEALHAVTQRVRLRVACTMKDEAQQQSAAHAREAARRPTLAVHKLLSQREVRKAKLADSPKPPVPLR
eukprot:2797153-Alexandrium_andersonii.AAC.1